LNKIILISTIVAVIGLGSLGLYFATTLDQPSQSQTAPREPSPQTEPTKIVAPSKFPYQFNKEVFSETEFPEELFLSNNPIKFQSNEEVLDFLKQAVRFEQEYSMVIREAGPMRDALMAPIEPQPEPIPSPPPSMREGRVFEETLELSQRRLEAGPTHGVGSFSSTSGQDYSSTNVQVQNVDEPDYLKTDGKYVYIGSQNTISIIDGYPPEQAKLILRFALDIESQNIENMFLNGDRLVIMYHGTSTGEAIPYLDFVPYPVYSSKTIISVIDVSDKQKPSVISKHEVDGNYYNSRMIGNVVYVISVNNADYVNPIIPRVLSGSEIIYPDIYRFPNPEQGYNFNTITAVDVSGKLLNSETFLMGYTNSIYVSEENLYITYQKNLAPLDYESIQKARFFDVIVPLLPKEVQDQIKSIQNDPTLDSRQKWGKVSNLIQDTYNKMSKEQKDELFSKIQKAVEEYDSRFQNDVRRTVIHKIALDEGSLTYLANTDVPGYPLNQFSMDEHSGLFRIATTSEIYQKGRTLFSNNVYVLDEKLDVIGKLEKIAPDERIYSSRFLGDKLYLVTFRQVDPFFVIDLASGAPKILGELKIPGFSNYLQPYDQNHIIGIGRDTKETQWGGFEQRGVKISMFDVTDFNKPKEKDTIVIGDSGSYSEILDSHKALLLDKEKNVMSIPIKTSLASLKPQSQIKNEDYSKNWHGFYVYGFDRDGFVEKGTITHYQWQNVYNFQYMPSRSFYIGNYLYTVMDGSMKINDLEDLDEINSIKIQQTGNIIPFVE
jgi:uncharacterized secreted protein with C-terminal beta-propeller domain